MADNNPESNFLDHELEQWLYSSHAEVNSPEDLTMQRGTPIPALFNVYYKFIQNPSSVSVETFKRMVDTDDTIGSGVDLLTTMLAARLGAYQHKNPNIAKFINQCMEKVDGGFTNMLKELLSATWAGFAVQEQVWANDATLGFYIKKSVSLPPSTILFEAERTGELTPDGILQYQRNYNPAMSAGGPAYMFGFGLQALASPALSGRPDPYAKLGDFPFPIRTANIFSYMCIRIPTTKVIHYAFDAQGKFGNPYGKSLLRRAYKYWIMKDAFLQMLSIALDRKGTPLTLVYCDASASVRSGTKIDENSNARGANAAVRADVAARNAFKNIHNDSVIILPGKKGQVYEAEALSQQANASDFIQSIDLCNRSLMRALLLPSLIFTSGDGAGSFALGQEHAKTFDKILDGVLEGVREVLLQQYVKRLLLLNIPRQEWENEGLGTFAKKEMAVEEIERELAAIERAVNMGAVDMNDANDKNAVREKIGMEPLNVGEVARDMFESLDEGLNAIPTEANS